MPEISVPPDRIDVVGLDHIYLTVSDLERSERFYDSVLELLDFRKGDKPIAGEPHRHYFNRVMQISIRPGREGHRSHDPYGPGLHHLCLQVETVEDVDRAAAGLAERGIATTAPAFYPEYAPDYYATFFKDPDGLRFEIVARRAQRRLVVERWAELTTFLNPVSMLKS